MSITQKVRALLTLTGKMQNDLIVPLDMSSKQSLYNKFTKDRWTGRDLIAVAEATGCKLAFILPNGDQLTLDSDPENEKSADSQ